MGEASKSVDQLLRTVARTTAEGAARLRMTRSMETATGMVVSRLRRQWGMAAWAANVEVLLARRGRLEAGPSPRAHANGRHGNARASPGGGDAPGEYRRAGREDERYRTAQDGRGMGG